jgi:hypothetical protein
MGAVRVGSPTQSSAGLQVQLYIVHIVQQAKECLPVCLFVVRASDCVSCLLLLRCAADCCDCNHHSRPGQCGRCDGYILEGRELEFYVRKMQKKKKGTAAA